LHARISYAGKMGAVARNILYMCIVLSLPIIKILPRDIVYIIAKR
jgi:hypothetical protein